MLTRSTSAAAALLSARDGGLAGLVAGGDDDLAGRLEDDRLLGRVLAQGLDQRLGCLLLLDQLGGAVGALLLEAAP